jgi:hypothetical protein
LGCDACIPDSKDLADQAAPTNDGMTNNCFTETGAQDACAAEVADAGCAACESVSAVCLGGSCRPLAWSSPQSTYVLPQPAPSDSRRYSMVNQDTLYAVRVRVPYDGMLVRLGMLLSTNQPPTSFRTGIYSDNGGYPLHPLVTPEPQVSATNTGGTGRQEVPISPAVHIQAGIYWLTVLSHDNPVDFQSPGDLIETVQTRIEANDNPWPDPFPVTSDPAMTTPDGAVILYAAVAVDP